jgi:hypothetical protein
MGFCTYREEVDRIGLHWMGAFCGWRDLQTKGRIPVHLNLHSSEHPDGQDSVYWRQCRDHFYTWLDQQKPDLIIANSLFFHEWLQERDYDIPGDIGFVHLGVNSAEKTVSGVDQNHRQIGAAAVGMIISQLQKNTCGVPDSMQTVLTYGSWIDGGTTR